LFRFNRRSECKEIFGIIASNNFLNDQNLPKYLIKEDKHEAKGVSFLDKEASKRLIK
jgi:hypothetical protein